MKSILDFLKHVELVCRGYDKKHHRNALIDCIGAFGSIILTTAVWLVLVAAAPEIPNSYYSVVAGCIRGAQLFFGIVLATSLLGFLFNTFSPYRNLFASMIGTAILMVGVLTKLDVIAKEPEFFGMALVLAITCYSSMTGVVRILVSESSFASKWREISK